MLSITGTKFRHFLKALLKEHGHKYPDLAKHLKVSLPTVNRILNTDDIPLERLIEIADFFEITIDKLFEKFSHYQERLDQFTEKQELYLYNNPEMLYFLILLNSRRTLKEISEEFECSQKVVKEKLFELAKYNFIEIKSGHSYSVKVRGPFKMNYTGNLSKKIFPKFAEIAKRFPNELKRGLSDNDRSFYSSFEIYLSDRSMVDFCKEIQDIILKYQRVCHLEAKSSWFPEIKPITGLIRISQTDTWKQVYKEHFQK